jgi:hypothetical protein
MKLSARLLALLICVATIDCAFADEEPGALATPDEKLDYLLRSWRGKTLDELRAVWGREASVEPRGETQLYIFERRVKVRVSPFGGVSIYGPDGLRCVARFAVDSGGTIVRTSRVGGGQECWNQFRRYEAPEATAAAR